MIESHDCRASEAAERADRGGAAARSLRAACSTAGPAFGRRRDGRDSPLDLAARDAPGDGRLQPLGADQDRLVQGLGIDVKLIAGPTDALATTKFVGQNKADMGYPSPGVLTSIDGGIEVKSIWNMISGQVFDFACPPQPDQERRRS